MRKRIQRMIYNHRLNWLANRVKALANGLDICFNILSILLNGNAESVCHPPSTVLRRVETMLKRCWIDVGRALKKPKLCFNIRSAFILFSGMFGILKRSWSRSVCLAFSTLLSKCMPMQWRGRIHGVAMVSADPIMEDYDTPDDFEVEINTATRKRKAP